MCGQKHPHCYVWRHCGARAGRRWQSSAKTYCGARHSPQPPEHMHNRGSLHTTSQPVTYTQCYWLIVRRRTSEWKCRRCVYSIHIRHCTRSHSSLSSTITHTRMLSHTVNEWVGVAGQKMISNRKFSGAQYAAQIRRFPISLPGIVIRSKSNIILSIRKPTVNGEHKKKDCMYCGCVLFICLG